MARRRFFVDGIHHGLAQLTGEQAHHASRVLRVAAGQKYEISDNDSVYLSEVESARRDLVVFRVISPLVAEAPPVRLTLLASLIKFERMELIYEKATELGVERIVPVIARRSDKGLEKAAGKRLKRWQKIALESSQQSRRVRLPGLDSAIPFREAASSPADFRFLLDESSAAPALLGRLPDVRNPSDTVALLVGPEGGWTDKERKEALDAGWSAVSLGPQVLRTETSAIAAIAVLNSAWHAGVHSDRHEAAVAADPGILA